MKAAIIESDKQLTVRNIPAPTPKDYEALCSISFGSTCRGTDLNLIAGKHPHPVTYPTIMGHESIGRIISVGAKVKNFKVGQLISRVGAPAGLIEGLGSNWGGFAQYGIAVDHKAMCEDGFPKEKWDRYRVNQVIPDGIDERQCPMIITWRETLSYLKRLGISSGKKILVIGSGANALSFVAHAHNRGLLVATSINLSHKEVFTRAGADFCVDYHNEDYISKLENYCPDGFDFIVDAVGISKSLNNTLHLLKNNGVIGIYGWKERAYYSLNPFMAKASFYCYCNGYDEAEVHNDVISDILNNKLDASLWYDINNTIPLSKITDAYEFLRQGKALKYLIDMSR